MKPKQPPLRILTNGCSHSRACIPDLTAEEHFKSSWPRVLEAMDNYDVDNIAQDGKANHYIVEETIRYIYNEVIKPDVVIVQLTDFVRINLFDRNMSGTWIPGVFSTQQGYNMTTKPPYVKIPGLDVNDLAVDRTIARDKKVQHQVGDSTHTYEQITTLTLLAALSNICDSMNIRLGIVPYLGFNDSIEDETFNSIPKHNWIVENPKYGLYNDLLYYYDTPDTYHFEAAAHKEVAQIVADWITDGNQITVNELPWDNSMRQHMFIYD